MPNLPAAAGFPRLTYLRIKNYRALRDVELRDLTPLTVLIGPNGSGKSTVLDALAFLAEAVSGNLQQAWEKRNRFAGMRTRGQEGPIEFEVEIAGVVIESTVYYTLIIDEEADQLVIVNEKLIEKDRSGTPKTSFMLEGNNPEVDETGFGGKYLWYQIYTSESAKDIDPSRRWQLASGADFDGFVRGKSNARVSMLLDDRWDGIMQKQAAYFIDFITSYRYIHLTDDHLKGYSDAGPREKLSANGDNLPNVLYYLHTKHPEALARISEQLRRWVPGLAEVVMESTSDERLLLRFKDAPFERPLPAQYMSDGTMRLAALLTLLYEPNVTGLLGIEEPENELHPRLLPRLAEELIHATETRQLLVATHSPALLNSMEPEQVWILHRGADGYTQASRVADMPDIVAMVEEGSPLGYLWSRNFFEVGDPLASPSATPTQE
jgi:predicted ATPase